MTKTTTLADHLRTIANFDRIADAEAYAANLRGAMLRAVIEASGATTYGTVAARRTQLVMFVIGAALNSASIRFHNDPTERAAFLARVRARWS